MTCTERMRNEVIDDMMVDAGLWNAPEVRTTLGTLASLAALKAPRAGAELAAMLAGCTDLLSTTTAPDIATAPEIATTAEVGATAAIATTPMAPAAHAVAQPAKPAEPAKPAQPLHFDALARRRWLRKNRPIVIGAAVLTAMGLGVGGVAAATASLPGGQQNIIQRLITHWAPAWAPAPPAIRQPMPSPDSPGVRTVPSSGAVPSNAPAPTGPAAHQPGAGDSQQGKGGQGSGSQPGQPPAGQSGQDGQGGKVSVQGTADGAAAAGTAIRTAATTASTSVKTAAPLVLLKTVDAVSLANASLPSWLVSLTAR